MFGIDLTLCDSIWEVMLIVAIFLICIVVYFLVVVALSTFIAWAVEFIFGDWIADIKLLRTILIAIGFAAPMLIIKGGN